MEDPDGLFVPPAENEDKRRELRARCLDSAARLYANDQAMHANRQRELVMQSARVFYEWVMSGKDNG